MSRFVKFKSLSRPEIPAFVIPSRVVGISGYTHTDGTRGSALWIDSVRGEDMLIVGETPAEAAMTIEDWFKVNRSMVSL